MKASYRKNGWSLIELTIILVVLSVLAAILAPTIDRYVRNAKVVRAKEDTQAIGSAMWMFIKDTGQSFFLRDPSNTRGSDSDAPSLNPDDAVDLLVSDGDVPVEGTGSSIGDWNDTGGGVDFFSNHLVRNEVGYRTPTDRNDSNHDDWERESSSGFNARFSWRGPYITGPIDPDPWGNRYASNVEFLYNPVDSNGNSPWTRASGTNAGSQEHGNMNDTVVVSAGPDEEIDSDHAADGLQPGDDDILYVVSGNTP